jgi:putative phosphoesterase
MRVAALYDIHGNLPALDAVLQELGREGVDRIVIGGDVIPGPMSRESLERVLDLGVPTEFVRGNGEVAVLAERAGTPSGVPEAFRDVVRWSGQALTRAQADAIAGWPKTVTLRMPALGDVLFCHATPRDENEIFTKLTPDDRLRAILEGLDVALVICGHTHMQFDRTVGGIRVVNAGSVGMPFGAPGADWLLLGPGVELRHTVYDLDAAAQAVRATSYPKAEDFASRNLLRPPSEEQILQAYAQAAGH